MIQFLFDYVKSNDIILRIDIDNNRYVINGISNTYNQFHHYYIVVFYRT